jgi:hypothetical protein
MSEQKVPRSVEQRIVIKFLVEETFRPLKFTTDSNNSMGKSVLDVAIYICKDNHLSNCSIIFITIAQYTQMYWNNWTALAEDNTATP